MSATPALLSLMQWLSPAFPTGAFAYSHGMEWAISVGDISDAASAEGWLSDVLRFGAGWQDAVLLACALRGEDVADHACALAPSRERLAETLDQAPPEKSELLLAKLALLLAQDLGDADRFAALAQAALQDL